MNKPLNWFEIPAADLDRARTFYEAAFNIQLPTENFGPTTLAIFPYDRDQATGGALVLMPDHQPNPHGPILYLNAGLNPSATLDEVLERAAQSGGKVMLPRTALPPGMGFYALIVDSEGNRIGVHGLN